MHTLCVPFCWRAERAQPPREGAQYTGPIEGKKKEALHVY